MRTPAQSFSRQTSQFIATEITRMGKQEAKQAIKDLKRVTKDRQWNFVEYKIRDILLELVNRHYMSLN